jgi:multiple sugar transport system permease protein
MTLAPTFIFLVLLAIYPLVYALTLSFYGGGGEGGHHIFVGLQNYINVVKEDIFLSNLKHSLQFCLFVVLLQNILGMSYALLLNTNIIKNKYKNILRAIQFLPWLLPDAVVACIWLAMYLPTGGFINTVLRNLGLYNLSQNWLGQRNTVLLALVLAESWAWYAFFSITYLAAMQNIPESLYEASVIDGANKGQIFFYITLPLLKPIILTTSTIQFIWLFRYFDLIWIMTRGGPAKATETVATQIYKYAFFNYDLGKASALGGMGCIVMLIGVIIYLYFYNKAEKSRG